MPVDSRIRVLVVDDEPDMLFLLGALIDDDQVEVVGKAKDGPAAVKLAGEAEPDIAVIDYMMPGMNGLEVADKLRELQPGCYNLIFSAYANIASEADTRPSIDGFLPKDQVRRISDVLHEIARDRGLVA